RAARRTASAVVSEIRPAALPLRTSETVVCETPARRATSTLVTLRGLGEDVAMSGSHHAPGSTGSVLRSTVLRMTPPRIALLLLTGVALAAGSVATASSDEPTRAGPPAGRVAVIAGADVTADTLSGVQGAATIRRVGGTEEAQAQAASLA